MWLSPAVRAPPLHAPHPARGRRALSPHAAGGEAAAPLPAAGDSEAALLLADTVTRVGRGRTAPKSRFAMHVCPAHPCRSSSPPLARRDSNEGGRRPTLVGAIRRTSVLRAPVRGDGSTHVAFPAPGSRSPAVRTVLARLGCNAANPWRTRPAALCNARERIGYRMATGQSTEPRGCGVLTPPPP